MNDVILLPIVVLCMLALRAGGAAPAWEIGSRAVGLFLLGPDARRVRGLGRRSRCSTRCGRGSGVRRDYESLYALGVAFTAYAAAEAVGGSGFLAAFAAGLVIAALDVELCDCFLDYGEASAEMFLLLTFVAFGAGLIWTGLRLAGDWRMLLVRRGGAAGADRWCCCRCSARAGVDAGARRIIALFGPRGLELAAAGAAAGVRRECRAPSGCSPITCLVVLLSVVIHGGGIALYLRRRRRRGAAQGRRRRRGGQARLASGRVGSAHRGAEAATPPRQARPP